MSLKATRPLEYVAFFSFEISTGEGNGHVFLACDAYLDFVFNLSVERDRKPETVLKNIYFLLEHPDFTKYLGRGFTLVLDEFQDLIPRIEAIISPENGKVLFNKAFNNTISNPVLLSIRDRMLKQR